MKIDKNDDAQMSVDYIAGISIFLIAVMFVFQFVHGLFIPFKSGSDSVTLSADRVSTVLIERYLAVNKSNMIGTVDQGKLLHLTDVKLNISNYSEYKKTLKEVGLFNTEVIYDLNVSVMRFDNSIMSKGGPSLPNNIDIGQTKRMVLIINKSTDYNETAFVEVRVW